MTINFKGCLILNGKDKSYPKDAEIGDAYEVVVETEARRGNILLAKSSTNHGVRVFDGKYWQELRNILKDTEYTTEDVFIKDGDSIGIEKRKCKKIVVNNEDCENNTNQQESQQETDWKQQYYKWKSEQK